MPNNPLSMPAKELFCFIKKVDEKRDNLLLDKVYFDRCVKELKAIDIQGKHEYFSDLYKKNIKYPQNENNLVIPYILGIVPDFDIEKDPVYTMGEYPDIDVDFLPVVRDYLKREFLPKEYGARNVCGISNYTTFGIKSALIDMAKVHGYDRNEILNITTKIGLKDEDGKTFTWEKIVESNEDLKNYLADKEDVAYSAKKLLHRYRGRSKHAGGVIISKDPIDDVVPLVLDTDGNPCSAWTEGLASTDLQPMGYIKFDLLVITDLLRIVECCNLIKKRHPELKEKGICALEGMPDWSDISYLNDEKSIALANEGRLKGVFQFDSDGIRRLCKNGGVTSFDDIPAYSSLYRPGPLGMGMDQRYIKRKRGDEQGWEDGIHPKVMPIVDKTYGVLCIEENTLISISDGSQIPIKDAKIGNRLHSVNLKTKKIDVRECHGCGPTRINETGYVVKLKNGKSVCLTDDHEVLTFEGMKAVKNLDIEKDLVACPEDDESNVKCDCEDGDLRYYQIESITKKHNCNFYGISVDEYHNLIANGIVVKNCYQEQIMQILGAVGNIPASHQEIVRKAISKKKDSVFGKYKEMFLEEGQKNLGYSQQALETMWDQIASFAEYGFNKSHAFAYSYVSARLLYLKANFPIEFHTTTLVSESDADKIVEYRREAELDGYCVEPININKSKVDFAIMEDEGVEKIYMGFAKIKGIGKDVAEEIARNQPYTGLEDFIGKFGTDAKVLKPIISLCMFGDAADRASQWEFTEYYKKEISKRYQRDKRHEQSKGKYIDEMRYVISTTLGEEKEKLFNKNPAAWFDDIIQNRCFDTLSFKMMYPDWCSEGDGVREIIKIVKKYRRSVEDNTLKKEADPEISFQNFEPTGNIDDKMKELFQKGAEMAEEQFYGFEWKSVVYRSPSYNPERTFSQFEDPINHGLSCSVQVVIKGKPIFRTTKKKGAPYWVIPVKDANGREEKIVFWQEDYDKFEKLLDTYDPLEGRGGMYSMKVVPWYGGMYEIHRPKKFQYQELKELDNTSMKDDPRITILDEPEEDKKILFNPSLVIEKFSEGF